MSEFDDDFAKKAINSYINNYDKNNIIYMDGFETIEDIQNEQNKRFNKLITQYNHTIHVKLIEYHTLNGELPHDIKISVNSYEFINFINFDDTIKKWIHNKLLKKHLYYSPQYIFNNMISEIHKMNSHIHDYKATFDGKTIYLIKK